MRALFALLVLLNLIFFLASSQDTSQPGSTEAQKRSQETPALLLISELPLSERPGKRPTLSADGLPDEIQVVPDNTGKREPVPVTTQNCYRFEAFPDEKALAIAKAHLREVGARLGASGVMSVEKRRYWVVLPRFNSRAQAEPVMRRLREAGVRDFYFISAGENRNTISLGLFSSADAAQRRVQELAPLRLKVDIREVFSASRAWYLEVGWEQSPGELEKIAGASGASVSVCHNT